MPHDVFISYSSHDKAVADATCAALEAQRIRCWIAPRDVLAGTEYAEAIVSAIEGCRAMVLIFSAHANESPHIRREVERAVSKGKFIVPFRIEDVLPSRAMEYCLSNTHWLDALTPPLEMRIGELVASVSRLLNRQDSTAAPTAPAQNLAPTETKAQRFTRLFTEQPDVIAEVEAEASRAAQQMVAEFEKLLLRLELNVKAPDPPGSHHPHNLCLNRILGLVEQFDAELEEARAFVAASRQPDVPYGQWYERLYQYQRATGSTAQIRK
jgi:hypothetical protein